MIALMSKALSVVDSVMLEPVEDESVIRAETVRVNHALWHNLSTDNLTQGLSGDILHNSGIYPAITLEKAKNRDLTSSTAPSTTFPVSSKITFIYLHLALEWAFLLTFERQAAADDLVDSFGAMPIDAQGSGSGNCRNLDAKVLD